MKIRPEKGYQGYLTIAETKARLGRSRWTVHRLVRAGILAAVKRGASRNARVLITEASVRAYEKTLAVPPVAAAGKKEN